MIGITGAGIGAWAAIAWQAVNNTLFGYCVWATLLARYPAATIAPFASLAPVYGSGASVILLREPLPMWKLVASGMVIAWLAIGFIDTKKLAGGCRADNRGTRARGRTPVPWRMALED